MNALESGPNDFKLITPSKYIVGKVVGSNCYELELPIRISTIPVVDTCLVLLLLLLLWGSVVADSGDPLSAWLQLLALVWSEAEQEGEGRNATGRSTVSEVCNKSSYFRYTAECDGDGGNRSCRHHSHHSTGRTLLHLCKNEFLFLVLAIVRGGFSLTKTMRNIAAPLRTTQHISTCLRPDPLDDIWRRLGKMHRVQMSILY